MILGLVLFYSKIQFVDDGAVAEVVVVVGGGVILLSIEDLAGRSWCLPCCYAMV